jgi:chromosome partitioning protein
VKTIAFFNNKGGVGKTSLVYHLGWTFADLGKRILLVDLDPQSNLTAMCVDEERLEALWVSKQIDRRSMRGAVQPIIDGIGDVQDAHCEPLDNRLAIIPGDIQLTEFEQKLSDAWPRCMDRDPAAFRAASSFHRIIQQAGRQHGADLVLIDVGPNLGAINRSALIAADHVLTPLGADLFSIQGLKNLGPTLARWREEWKERSSKNPVPDLELPTADIDPVGYVVMQPNLYGGQVTKAYNRWLHQIPGVYAEEMLGKAATDRTIDDDPYALCILKHYRSLMPMAQTARKPIFKLTAADGAIGSHSRAVQDVGKEFRALAKVVSTRVGAEGSSGETEA